MREYFVTATINLTTAMHIGSGKGNDPTDAPIRRSADGRLLIPGPAIAGSLRTTATRLAPRMGMETCQALAQTPDWENICGCPVCQLFGDVHPIENPEGNNTVAKASRLWIYDAFADAASPTFVRDGVGIDRHSGHAADNVKFDYEVVPRKTQFKLKLRLAYEPDETEADMLQLLAVALAEWEAGRGQLGGNVSRGLGRFKLKNLTYKETKLDTGDDLVAYLKAPNRAAVAQSISKWPGDLLTAARNRKLVNRDKNGRSQSIAGGFITVKFNLQFTDLFLQHDPLVALLSGFDHAPLIENLTDDGLGKPLLGGSSIRGVLRSQSGKIIRTLYTDHCLKISKANAGENFKENCPSCSVLEDDALEPIASCTSRIKQDDQVQHYEWAEEDFCLTCQLFGNQERGSRLWVQDAHWLPNEQISWQAQDFLAIDRFTGGGLDGAKFDAAPLTQAKFRAAITLNDPTAWELGLLALLLRDLAEKRITVGFGAAKGYGRFQATNFNWKIGFITDSDLKEAGNALFPAHKDPVESGLYNLYTHKATGWLPVGWAQDAQRWVDTFNKTIKDFHRSSNLDELQADTFFGTPVADLYGRSRTEVK